MCSGAMMYSEAVPLALSLIVSMSLGFVSGALYVERKKDGNLW